MARIVIEAELSDDLTSAERHTIAEAMLKQLPDGTRFTYGSGARAAEIARDSREARQLRVIRRAFKEIMADGN